MLRIAVALVPSTSTTRIASHPAAARCGPSAGILPDTRALKTSIGVNGALDFRPSQTSLQSTQLCPWLSLHATFFFTHSSNAVADFNSRCLVKMSGAQPSTTQIHAGCSAAMSQTMAVRTCELLSYCAHSASHSATDGNCGGGDGGGDSGG